MKVTEPFLNWIRAEAAKRGWTYAEMARRSGKPYQTFQRIWQGVPKEINEDTVSMIAKLFDLDINELYAIARGKLIDAKGVYADQSVESAMALWRWLKHDDNRCSAIKAMGFKGALPCE